MTNRSSLATQFSLNFKYPERTCLCLRLYLNDLIKYISDQFSPEMEDLFERLEDDEEVEFSD